MCSSNIDHGDFPFCFPTELDREIFETTAILYPEEIPNLMLVARRVKIWRYLAVALTAYSERKPTYSHLRSLPDLFLRERVKHLCLHEVNHTRGMLDTCCDIVDLSLNCASPALFPFLEPMSLKRLSTHIGDLLDDFTYETLSHSVFTNITHLTLFDRLYVGTWDEWQDLVAIPALTHLCLSDEVSRSILHGVLEHCTALHLLVNQWRDLAEIQPEEYCAVAGVTDPRFVMLETGDWVYEWELSARGCVDMWDRASAFVADKKRGVIPESQFWLYSGYWEAVLDFDRWSEATDNGSVCSEDDIGSVCSVSDTDSLSPEDDNGSLSSENSDGFLSSGGDNGSCVNDSGYDE
ncbi:hypothetical protein C8R44DRAFT_865645 [Mycena epipterygia]|nr:hypothetical protein C8R44DRAFT_865645 [Mycena epipterygia]